MKRHNVLTSFVVAAAATAALTVASPAQAQMKSITIGTNPSGTLYNLLGGLMAKTFQSELKIRATAQPYAGSSVYLPLLDKGEITMGLNSSLDTALAYNGKDPYKSPLKKVRSLIRFWVLPYAYFARGDSGITSIDQLKGKRVVVGFKANVALANLNRTMLLASNLTVNDVVETAVSGIPDGINAVVEGRVDAATIAVGVPIFQKADSTTPGGLRILALNEGTTDQFMSEHTKGSKTYVVEPSKRNAGVVGPTKIAAFDSYVNIAADVSDEDAYKLAKVMYTKWLELGKEHPVFKGLKPDEIVPPTNVAPYHPGAIKYYKEAGIWTDAHEKNNASLK